MDDQKAAAGVLECIGGKENIISAAHCATRLRLVIADNSKVNKETLEAVEGVKGVFEASGQLQIIFGTGVVNKVYDAFIQQAGIQAMTKDEVKAAAAQKGNPFQRFIKVLGDIFVPIIPAIVASGFLMGIMESLSFLINNGYLNLSTDSAMFVLANLFANTAYVFLPVLIGFSGAKVFGGNPYLGAIIGMIMVHPNLQNAWTMTGGIENYLDVFGLWEVPFVGYQGHVISVIIAVFVMVQIEKFLHKHVPAMLDLFVTPLVSVFVTGFLTMTVIGPIFNLVESSIINAIQALISIPFGIGSLVMGALYAPTVITGIHHMYTIIDLGQLKEFGYTYWLPLASAANIAQGAAALAVALKTKDSKLKSMALPSSLSAFMGITEPAIFGVNVRFFRPFVCACIGGGVGAMFASITGLGASGTGVTGIFGILLCLGSPLKYILMFLISAGVSFVLTWLFGYRDSDKAKPSSGKKNAAPQAAAPVFRAPAEADGKQTVLAPLSGRAITLQETGDETFGAEVLGQGAAIEPSEGKVYAPFDATVSALMGHAVALEGGNGVEMLIHVGIDTVKLEGRHYTPHCVEGDAVKAGDLLLEFDLQAIRQEGYPTVTAVIITNTDDYQAVAADTGRSVSAGDKLLTLQK